MQLALALARRQLGQTWPNPAVGAVVVKDGQIVGQGVTGRGGRPHAETEALAQAGALARGATLYVSLEPCSHQGKTAPCAEAVISAGISRVVVACKDSNPLISGRGIALLATKLTVIEGVCEAEARALNAGFFSVMESQLPWVSVKLAISLDGRIASANGESQWITSEKARHKGWLIRSHYDSIITGSGTLLADDPDLTCRIPGLEQNSPVRLVFDRNNRLNTSHKLAKTAKITPVWVFYGREHPQRAVLEALGVQFFSISGENDTEQLIQAMQILAKQGITRVLVEAGATLSTAFLQSGLCRRMYWFRAPVLLGNDGLAGVGGGFPASLADATRWVLVEQCSLGPDQLDVFECLPALSAKSAS